MYEWYFDEWIDDLPTGRLVVAHASDRLNAMRAVVAQPITFINGLSVVPTFCPLHGTVRFDAITYQLRSDPAWPNIHPDHPEIRPAG